MYFSSDGRPYSEEEIQKLDREYALLLLERLGSVGAENCDLKLFQKGFLQRFRDYLYGDWNRFYLFESKPPLNALQPWSNEVPCGCQIFICCVGAAYWEVFVESPALLARLKDRFPEAIPFRLDDKTT